MRMTELQLPLDGKILCAVSGGADSMCLLHMIYSRGLEVVAAHYEHGIRGEEALRDAGFVEEWCREKSIECIVGHGDVPSYAELTAWVRKRPPGSCATVSWRRRWQD